MRATPPPTPPPISAPRWLDDDGGVEVGKTVWMITFVVVMRPPLAADVTTDTTELVLRLVGEVCAAPFPASLVAEVDVNVVSGDKVEVGIIRTDELDELDVDVVVVSLDVVSPLPELPELPWFPIMAAEATAGPAVLIEATEVPLGNGKKSLGLVLSQQTLDALRLWSQHQLPP